jgi:hypothetical protein
MLYLCNATVSNSTQVKYLLLLVILNMLQVVSSSGNSSSSTILFLERTYYLSTDSVC